MAGEQGRTATVVRQEGTHVLVSVPMVGFPPGFQLRPGERVVLVSEEAGSAVRPLVQARVVEVERSQLREPGTFEIRGQVYSIQPSSLFDVDVPEDKQGEAGERVVWIVDPGTAEGPAQVVAFRPRRR